MSEEQKAQAKTIMEATDKLPDALKEAAVAYIQGMAAAAKLIKGAQETGAA